MQAAAKPHRRSRRLLRFATSIVAVILGIIILIGQRHGLDKSSTILRHAQAAWLAGMVGLLFVSFGVAAAGYATIALHKLRLHELYIVELASACINKILPAGIGGLGIHGDYLIRHRHSVAEATAVVSTNNAIGITAHIVLLVALLLIRPNALPHLRHSNQVHISVWWLMVPLVMIIVINLVAAIRLRLQQFIVHFLQSLRRMHHDRLFRAFLLAGCQTFLYTSILFAATRTIGVVLAPSAIFLVFTAGMLTGTIVPTPGGLVGAEAGLYAGLIAYGVSMPQAAAIVIIYRAVTFWAPLLPGIPAVLYGHRKGLI